MEGVALLLSVQVTQRGARSALPDAEVEVTRPRWHRTREVVRRIARGRA
jgi:hypothetical protein